MFSGFHEYERLSVCPLVYSPNVVNTILKNVRYIGALRDKDEHVILGGQKVKVQGHGGSNFLVLLT